MHSQQSQFNEQLATPACCIVVLLLVVAHYQMFSFCLAFQQTTCQGQVNEDMAPSFSSTSCAAYQHGIKTTLAFAHLDIPRFLHVIQYHQVPKLADKQTQQMHEATSNAGAMWEQGTGCQ